MSTYLNNPWKPAPVDYVRDSALRQQLETEGYAILNGLSPEILQQLKTLHQELHSIQDDRGGMFYGVYSQDLAYRKQVHERVQEILQPVMDNLFEGYRVLLNTFVIKAPGPESEFFLHQDTTGLDEREFSALNVWIPLQAVDETNGTLALIPRSHRFFSPWRSISFPAPFDAIQSETRPYLQPIRMEQGQYLVFDNRVLHNSFANTSGLERVVVTTGVFPEAAKLLTCYKPEPVYGGQVELIEHEDRFLLENKNFLINCHERSKTGTSLGFVEDPYPPISAEEFQQLMAQHGLEEFGLMGNQPPVCNLIQEPDHEQTNAETSKTVTPPQGISVIKPLPENPIDNKVETVNESSFDLKNVQTQSLLQRLKRLFSW